MICASFYYEKLCLLKSIIALLQLENSFAKLTKIDFHTKFGFTRLIKKRKYRQNLKDVVPFLGLGH